MFGYFYGFDTTYLLLVVPALIFSIIAQVKVKSAYSKYAQIQNQRRITGAEAAEQVLRAHGVYEVKIEQTSGHLSDHYDPRNNCIRLSSEVYSSSSIASVSIAAHEAGHAVQYASNYFPIKIRNAIIPISRFGSQFAIPLFLLGILFSMPALMYIGIIFFALAFLFQLITLPVEFNASRRAMITIQETALLTTDEEISGARKMLSAAAMTYLAAMLAALANLLRLISLANRRR